VRLLEVRGGLWSRDMTACYGVERGREAGVILVKGDSETSGWCRRRCRGRVVRGGCCEKIGRCGGYILLDRPMVGRDHIVREV
jgi:hypothetical protein